MFFGEEKSSPILLQIAPPVMLARLGCGFLFCGCGASPLDLNLPLSGMLYFVDGCHIRLRHFSRRFVDFMAIIQYTERYGCFAIL